MILKSGLWVLTLNKNGGIGKLTYNGKDVIKANDNPIIEYVSYGKKDYDFWLSNYSRNLEETKEWIMGDFSRPLLKYVEGKYPEGRFSYSPTAINVDKTGNFYQIDVDFECEEKLCEELGAPRLFQITYLLEPDGLQISADWYNKDANRLTEAIFLRLFPADCDLKMLKISDWINPDEVVSKGGRNLHAVKKCRLNFGEAAFDIRNLHSPLLSIGKGKILEYDNKIEDYKKDGIAYCLYNNVWGTNFPLWYEENAKFIFSIEKV